GGRRWGRPRWSRVLPTPPVDRLGSRVVVRDVRRAATGPAAHGGGVLPVCPARAAGPDGSTGSGDVPPLSGQVAPQVRGGLDALEEQVDLDLLVGRVPDVGRYGDAEEEHGRAEDVLEVGGGAGAALACVAHRSAEGAFHGPDDGPQGRVVERGEAGPGGRAEDDLTADAVGQLVGHPAADGLLDVVGVLPGDGPERQPDPRRRQADRLAAGALVAAADAVDLGGGAGPDAFEGGVAGLAVGGVGLGGAQPPLLVEGELGEEFPLAVGELGDAVVEAGDRDARVLVVQGG